MFKSFKVVFFIAFSLLISSHSFAASNISVTQQGGQSDQERMKQQEKDYELTLESALKAAIFGPKTVEISNQANLDIPEGYLYIPKKEAADFMHANGNRTHNSFSGMVLSRADDLRWFITIDFIDSGYVRDNEAKDWDADKLLKSLKDGTEKENKERIQNGFTPLHVVGWIEKPTYITSDHKLVWSMLAKDNDSSEATVNYNTYALGRDGYFEFNLVTPESAILQDKLHAKKILAALHFNNGKSYGDFVEGQDKVAAYGIAALVTGIVAKKLGLIALAGAFFIKMWKLLILVPFILGSKIRALFRRNKKSVIE